MITAILRAVRSHTAMRNDDIVISFRNTKIELTVNFCKNVKSCNDGDEVETMGTTQNRSNCVENHEIEIC